MSANDNERVIKQIVDTLRDHPSDLDTLRDIITMYGNIERNKAFQEILAISVSINTSLADYCCSIREISERPYCAI